MGEEKRSVDAPLNSITREEKNRRRGFGFLSADVGLGLGRRLGLLGRGRARRGSRRGGPASGQGRWRAVGVAARQGLGARLGSCSEWRGWSSSCAQGIEARRPGAWRASKEGREREGKGEAVAAATRSGGWLGARRARLGLGS